MSSPMNPPNYRRHALECFRDAATKTKDAPLLRALQLHIDALSHAEARSFILPENGEIIRHNTAARLSFDGVKLPFQRCILEYPISADWYEQDKGEKWHPSAVVLEVEQSEENEGRIFMSVAWRGIMNDRQVWIPSVIGIGISEHSILEVMNSDGQVRLENFQPHVADRSYGELADRPGMANEFVDECRVLGHFVLLCNCDNIRPERIYTPPAALQKKAHKSGRAPLNEYHVLNISLPSEDGAIERGESTGRHGVRFHVRRGHIRRLPTGRRTWVRQCAVGDPALGLVDKDYRVTGGAIS